MKTKELLIASFAILTIGCFASEALAFDFGPRGYRAHRPRFHDSSRLTLSFSFGEGVYFHYNCRYSCDEVAVAPADFELLAGVKLSRHWVLDLGAVWAMDFDRYGGRLTSMVGFRPGIRLLLPGLFHRVWYLRAAMPLLFGVSGENDDFLVGFMLGAGLELRYGALGIFGEIDFAPYFVEVADRYYVLPAQGRVGMALHF